MYIFIINPRAGNGRAKHIFSQITKSNLYQKFESTYYFTKYPGHAEEIANQILEDPKLESIIVIGGDGTIHEVLNGLANSSVPVAFIPGGSGNDFARGCNIKGSPLEVLRDIINRDSSSKPYWIGNYRQDQQPNRNFVNSIGFGFDAQIADTVNKSVYKNILNRLGIGTFSYVIALIQVLIRFKPMMVNININQKQRKLTNCWMVTTGNHPYYGGGMKIIPNAKIQPNILPVLIIHDISKWKVLSLFITVFFGKHLMFKEVEVLETTGFTIDSDQEIFFQVDGQTGTCKSCIITKQTEPVNLQGTNIR
ncbi:diacylglycerol/lipid kinase family protein [Oceanobacillus chungangensis]|uniref:Diacylglycerol kinase n=1 Tax=Oceanobacillus chungangensis TaxID=1229152 RepID=A0A3D8PIJ1_9BACI|nr:diacylglycerol kinase family protein [Oceanobacillus chungangensis]RDW15913.1 diacylglycerol kinase [Oceanobacillus chungangensis]